MRKPLSISLERLRRAQRSLIRRKRGSKVRVSFPHQQPVARSQRGQRSGERVPRPCLSDPPWIRQPAGVPSKETIQPIAHVPVRWIEDHRPLRQIRKPRHAPRKRTPYSIPTPYPVRQEGGCCGESFDEAKKHQYWGNLPQPDMSAPLDAKPPNRPLAGPSTSPARQPREALGYPPRYVKNGEYRKPSRRLSRPQRSAVRPRLQRQQENTSIAQTPEGFYKIPKPTPNSKRCGIADPEV
jgi:hypothetical protein